jgi:kynureninase
VTIITPTEPEGRGCQLSLLFRHRPVRPIFRALSERHGVFADVREPNVIRVSPAPLYNSFSDVLAFVVALEAVLRAEDRAK